ncbi:MAG: hypothetical protein HYR96_10760 [Deltaproteobacteria bacterium]|nr:hypothetical protein [Deltaproteobacteria bacterium]
MGFKIFSQLAFMGFVLLLGNITVAGQTIGHRFMMQVKNACLWTTDQVKKARLFADVMEAERAVVDGFTKAREAETKVVEKAKAVEANVGEKMEKVQGLSKEIEERLNKIRDEALLRSKKMTGRIEADSEEDGEDEDPVVVKDARAPAVNTVDQDALLKNLP